MTILNGTGGPIHAQAEVYAFYTEIERTKLVALIACTILVYEIVLTLPAEIHYIWGSRWSFARVVFHLNRMLGILVLGAYVPTLFIHGLSVPMCIIISIFYTYGTVLTAMVVATVLIVRIWIIYGRKTWLLITVTLGCLVVSVPSLVLLQMRARGSKFVPNPDPELISGCTLNTSPLGTGAYIGPFIYETCLFFMTVYKTWKISQAPLMQRLMRDGSRYYIIVLATLLFIGLGSFNKQMRRAVIGSGLLAAMVSSMCTRLILSTLSFYDNNKGTMGDLETNVTPQQSSRFNIPGSEWF